MKKNKYSTPLWMLATILAGMLSPMQSAVNGQLGHWLQDGNACAVISFASGLVVMFYGAKRNPATICGNSFSD